MNKSLAQSKITSLINIVIIFLAAAMPIFFLPITTEFFEFNKLALFMVGTVLMLLAWGVKVIVSKKLSIAKSSMDIPMILMTGVFVLSAIFSLNKTVSIYGSQGRWYPSLIGFLSMVVFYYVVTSNVESKEAIKRILYGFIGATTVASLISIMSYYGLYLGKQSFLQISAFSTTGSATTAAVIAMLAILLGFSLFRAEGKTVQKVLLGVAILVNLFMVVMSGFLPIWVTLGLGIIATVIFKPQEQGNKTATLIIAGIAAGIVMLSVFPATRSVIFGTDYGREIKLSIKESWIVASSTVRDFPLLGTGPSTFYLNFPRYRSAALNSTNLWNISFDKPYNEVFDVLASLGVIGIIIALMFGTRAVRFSIGNRVNNEMSFVLSLGLMAAMLSFLFSYSTVLTSFVFFLLLALSVANNNVKLKEVIGEEIYFTAEAKAPANTIGGILDDTNSTILRSVIAVPLFALAVAGGIYAFKMYPGEYYMRKAIAAARSNNGSDTYRYQALAINSNTRRASYRDSYAQTNLALVRALITKESLTDTDKQTIQTLISQALQSAQISTELLDPVSSSGWEARAGVYAALIGTAQDAHQWAIASLQRAIQLNPNNPRLRLDLGSIYYATGDYLSAASSFRQATILKGDYANAYYNFALSLKKLEDYASAKKAFEVTQTLVQPDSQDYELVAAEIKAIDEMPNVAGASTKPTVEELAKPAEPEKTKQEPIVNEGEEKKQEVVEGEPTTTAPATQVTPQGQTQSQ
ncbi:MAG: tetratricopeptide repeat protein [Patescibacteria group bacterium]|jgi:tetratricopeptide (TPR) repeat protein